MLPAHLHSGFLRCTEPNRMFPDLTDEHQASSMDLFTFLSREAEKTLRRSAGLSVPQSAYDGSRLPIPCPGTGPLRRRSSPPLHTAVKPSSSFRRKKCRRGAPSCVSASEEESPTAAAATPGAETPLLTGGRVAASKPASSSATALSPRLAAAGKPASSSATALSPRLTAAPPMPSSLAPAWCSEATPELEQRLRFFARQIKSFRRTNLMYSSPELMERIRQMERDYETAVRQFYCSLPSTPGLQGAAAPAAEQPTPDLQPAVELPEGPEGGLPPLPEPDTPQPVSARSDTPQPDTGSDTPQPDTGPDTPQPDTGPDTPQPDTGSDTPQPDTGPDTPQPDTGPDTPQPDTGPDTPQPDTGSDTPQPDTGRRGRRKRDTFLKSSGVPGDASAPAHAPEGLGDAFSSCYRHCGLGDPPQLPLLFTATGFSGETPQLLLTPLRGSRRRLSSCSPATEGLGNASASCSRHCGVQGTVCPSFWPLNPETKGSRRKRRRTLFLKGFKEQFVLVLAAEPRDEGFEEEALSDPVPEWFKEQFVLVLASEPRDEGFEEEAPLDPVPEWFKEQFVLVLASEPRHEGIEEEALSDPVPEGFKEQFVLVLASEPRDEGSPAAASASEGSPGSASGSEGSLGSQPVYEALAHWRPPELCACWGRPPGRPPELCFCFWPSCHSPHRPPWSGCFCFKLLQEQGSVPAQC
ncbi:hypothetical protein CRENBAI_015062 [Crenichthys baileyi]|uniref:Uncharacterized protein n=1 Tax=Crenichthys baileyi TaxID=28760 RepID=A0AAV9R115_9TELE